MGAAAALAYGVSVVSFAAERGDPAVRGEGHIGDCVPLPVLAPLERDDAERLAQQLKAVADPTRLQLISLIKAAPGGEACVCDLQASLGLRQPTVSHHLRVLAEAGLVVKEHRGAWRWYSLVPGALGRLGRLLR